MKPKVTFLFLCVCLSMFVLLVFAQNKIIPMDKNTPSTDSYVTLWNQVSDYEQRSLPKSAMKTVDEIYEKALKEKNSPELIKALIHQMKYEMAVDQSRYPECIINIEKYTAESKDIAEKSVLHSMLAQLYLKYYQAKNYTINTRTAVFGYVPEDIEEWTGNIFVQKITENVNLSLQAKKELQSTDVLKYEKILQTGSSSRTLRSTLYDFLVYQGIDVLKSLQNYHIQPFFEQTKFANTAYFSPVKDFIHLQVKGDPYDLIPQILKLYQDLLHFYTDNGNQKALILTDLERLEFVYNHTENDDRGDLYLNALSLMENQYEKNNVCVEVLYKKALYYQQSDKREIIPLSGTKKSVREGIAKAYQICLDGIKKYPGYERINLLVNLRNRLTAPYANIKSEQVVYPGKSLKLNISYQNMNQLFVEIYSIRQPISVYESFWSMQGQYKKAGVLLEKKTIRLINVHPYLESDTVIEIPMKNLGVYEYVIYSDKDKKELANQQFSVTRLASVSRAYDGRYEFLVVDRLSGKPVPGAKVNLYKKENNRNRLISSVTTGKEGLAVKTFADQTRLDAYNVVAGNDSALILSSTPWGGQESRISDGMVNRLNLFTDRGIYRPGQTVFFKGIAYRLGKDTSSLIVNQTYTLLLRDPNGKTIASRTLKTTDMGSFSGTFTLPSNLLNGSFVISTEKYDESVSFRVEEYKRPGFDISFLPVKETYHFGDQITVKGEAKTFSGVNLQHTKVKYRIVQRLNWVWGWRWDRGNGNQVAEGFVETDDKGAFEILFLAEKRFNDKKSKRISYTYEIQASITDTKGETQQSVTSIPVGDISMQMKASALEGNLEKEKLPEVSIQAFNLNNEEVSCRGTYEIYGLTAEQSLEKTLDNEDWKQGQLLVSGRFTSGEAIDVKALQTASSGKYRIVMKANDDRGREVTDESDFLLYSIRDKKPPVVTYEWLLTPKTFCAVGENAEIIYGSSAKGVSVLYEIFKDNKKLESSRLELDNESKKLEIPFKESYGDGVVVSLLFVKDGKFFYQNIPLQKKKPDPELTLAMEVFRDKLLPGQREEWKLSVKNADKKPVVSEILAGMYDKSLDKIYGHAWYFNPVFTVTPTAPYFTQGSEFRTVQKEIHAGEHYAKVPAFSYDAFNWFGLYFYGSSMVTLRGEAVFSSEAVDIADMQVNRASNTVAAAAPMAKKMDEAVGAGEDFQARLPEPEQPVQIRQNLNETAFFYPQLKTNQEGETLIGFTVPESNTSWKFMVLAHTKELKFGQLIKEAISQKKLMVSPNMPRFIRQGDKMTIATTVSNLSDTVIAGKVSIEFFDPATEKQTIVVPRAQQDFVVEAGKTVAASWSFEVPSAIDITACKIVARSSDFSDGEQHLLPVLPNRMLVTESLPLTISGKGSKTFNLNKLIDNKSNTLENYRLTLEFSENPVWYAVQALPAMTTPVDDNVISWFASYYANSLASSIAKNTPKIKQIIDSWIKLGGTKETLLSNLEKNQELKAVLLEETPWVMEAKGETEQKQRLALLFDINRNNNLSVSAMNKLKELQIQDGGWSWFKGMYSSVSITQWILYGMGQLSELKAVNYSDDEKNMQNRAIGFIDREFVRQFEYLKRYDPNWQKRTSVSIYELEYLFVRSFYKNPIEEGAEAVGFYSGIAEKNWAKTPGLYERALIAMIMQRNGKTAVAQAIVRSLREHASHKEDLGMFWANNTTRAFMFQSATAVHTFIMEAFAKTGATPQEMDEMKLWLLKQKQTQQWESTPATVNAISVLLRTGGNWLDSEGKVDIRLGKEKVEVADKEAGVGYYKKVYERSEISPDKGKVSITKQDDGPAWGALYWQYFEQLDQITQAKTSLQVEKRLFVEKISPSGKTLTPVTEKDPLKVGDKVVVRLTVRNDRDMEYVLLKDMRAACFEPIEQLSGIRWKERVVYYQSPKDASTSFYFYNLPKGTYVFEYPLYVTRPGAYSNGITSIQCLYAPEFLSNTAGIRVTVKE